MAAIPIADSPDTQPPPSPGASSRHIALIFGSFRGGGVGRAMLRLAEGFAARDFSVDLVVGRAKGGLLSEVPPGTRTIELERGAVWRTRLSSLAADAGIFGPMMHARMLGQKPSGKLRYLPSLAQYFRTSRPNAVLAATAPFNLIAVWARRLTHLDARIVVTEHNQLSSETVGNRRWRYDLPNALLRRGYMQADAIAPVSEGVAEELVMHAGIPRHRLTTVFNAVVGPHIARMAREPVDDPWLAPDEPPVVVGVGMLKPQNDFPTLIRAFARVRKKREARLVILGDVRDLQKDEAYRAELHSLPAKLGIGDAVQFPGFVSNPFPYLARAASFVLSAEFAGLPTVIIEALACGCPVVSTDCPSGPAEILDGGRFGPLVPVGNEQAMAAAIQDVLDNPLPRDVLQARAQLFSVSNAVDRYTDLLFGVHEHRPTNA